MTTSRGWTSDGLAALGEDPGYWTVSEAAALLGPPQLTPAQVRSLVHLCNLAPAGKRKSGPRSRGRHPRVYAASDLIRAYDAIYRVMDP